jgi:hypothetical protein
MSTPASPSNTEAEPSGLVERLRRPTDSRREGQCQGCYDAEREEAASAIESAQALLGERTRERDDAQEAESRWLLRVHNIRYAAGVGVKPMLDELPAAIAARIADAQAEAARLRDGCDALISSWSAYDAGLYGTERDTGRETGLSDCAAELENLLSSSPALPVGEGSSNANSAATRDHSLAATEAEPSAAWRLGQQVAIRPTYVYAADWRDATLYICGIEWNATYGEVRLSVSEHWPPLGLGDVTTDFPEDALGLAIPVAIAKVPGVSA